MDGLILLIILGGLYFLPTIVAFARGVSSPWSIAVINTFLGWTLIGWVVALAMAARSVPPKPMPAVVEDPNQPPYLPPPPDWKPPAEEG